MVAPTDHDAARLKDWKEGEGVSAAALNQTNRALERMWTGVDGSRQVGPDASGISARFEFQSVDEDTGLLVCRRLDDDAADTVDVHIAPPYLLRKTLTERDGITYEYTTAQERVATRTSDSSTETQVIVPRYVEGDELYASRVIRGTGMTDADDLPVVWLDDNRDARTWARKAT